MTISRAGWYHHPSGVQYVHSTHAVFRSTAQVLSVLCCNCSKSTQKMPCSGLCAVVCCRHRHEKNCHRGPIFSGYQIAIMLSCPPMNPSHENAARVLRAIPGPCRRAALASTVYSDHCRDPESGLVWPDIWTALPVRSSAGEDARSHRFCRRGRCVN